MRFRASWLALVLLSSGCAEQTGEPRAQWRVLVATDAPLPALGDRLLLEIVGPDGKVACGGCRRQLAVGDEERWPISFGIVPPESGHRLRLRARLFRSVSIGADGLPSGTLLIDALGRLPEADGVTTVSLELSMSCFGVVSDLGADLTCDRASGELVSTPLLAPPGDGLPAPGSWPPARPAPCPGVVPETMRCIEGGVFVLGSTREPEIGLLDTKPERLVLVKPFAIDVDEVTVGEVRELVLDGKLSAEPAMKAAQATSSGNACRYLGQTDAANDAFPVNCLSHELARRVCEERGAKLPTEAQWEFAASNRGTARIHPWSDAGDVCEHSIVGVGRSVLLGGSDEDTSCADDDPSPFTPGPVPEGHDADVNELGLKNLGGNLSEWVRDRPASYDAACWHPDTLLLSDPVCETDAEWGPQFSSTRGGNWALPPLLARIRLRLLLGAGGGVTTGFRCVREY